MAAPPDSSHLPIDSLVFFIWNPANDPDGQELTYWLKLIGAHDSTTFNGGLDTSLNVDRDDLLALLNDNCLTWAVWASDGEDSTRSDSVFTMLAPVFAPYDETLPVEFGLTIHPNPFNPATRLTFGLPEEGKVSLSIYDLSGRLVETLVNRDLSIGVHAVHWSAAGLPSGLYVARLEAGGQVMMRKMMMVK